MLAGDGSTESASVAPGEQRRARRARPGARTSSAYTASPVKDAASAPREPENAIEREQQRERRAPDDAHRPGPGFEHEVEGERRREREHHRRHVRAAAEALVARRRNRRRGLDRAVVVEDEQEHAPDGDRDRAEQTPSSTSAGVLGPGERHGDDEHERERHRPAERQPRAGRPERRRLPRRPRTPRPAAAARATATRSSTGPRTRWRGP